MERKSKPVPDGDALRHLRAWALYLDVEDVTHGTSPNVADFLGDAGIWSASTRCWSRSTRVLVMVPLAREREKGVAPAVGECHDGTRG